MSTQTTDTELKELLEKFSRNSIVLDISEEVPSRKVGRGLVGNRTFRLTLNGQHSKEKTARVSPRNALFPFWLSSTVRNYPGSTRKGCSLIMVYCRSSTKSTLNGGALIRLTRDALASIGLRT